MTTAANKPHTHTPNSTTPAASSTMTATDTPQTTTTTAANAKQGSSSSKHYTGPRRHSQLRNAPSKTLDVMSFTLAQPALIEASAGTGKTYTITNLVLRALLGSGTDQTRLERPLQLDELLIVTFTNAATSDLRQRIYSRIREARIYFENFLNYALVSVVSALEQNRSLEAAQANLKETLERHSQKKRSSKKQKAEEIIARKQVETMQRQQRHQSVALHVKDDSLGAGAVNASAAQNSGTLDVSVWSTQSYTDAELDDLLVDLNLDKLLREGGFDHDAILAALLRELLNRAAALPVGKGAGAASDDFADEAATAPAGHSDSNDLQGSLLRKAILVLTRAERMINSAAICTIHSFCNSALTQIFALEAGEAFNTELKLDLQDVIHEACYGVWRRLFYKKDSSVQLLQQLTVPARRAFGAGASAAAEEEQGPLNFYQHISVLNSVRLSDPQAGFFGYQLLGIEDLLHDCNLTLDAEQPLEPQLVAFIGTMETQLNALQEQLYAIAVEQLPKFDAAALAQFYDSNSGDFTAAVFDSTNKKQPKLVASGRDFLENVRSYFSSIEAVQAAQVRLEQVKAAASNEQQITVAEADYAARRREFFAAAQKVVKFDLATTALYNRRLKYDAAFMQPLVQPLIALQEALNTVLAQNDQLLQQFPLLVRTLVSIAMNNEIDHRCQELHVMSTDDVLRRLDYALNARDNLGYRLAWLIRTRYPLAMIDEFQDTDPVQFSIFSSIYLNSQALRDKSYCYLIGDPKQSIYAFRGSDINSYLKAKQRIVELTQGSGIYTLDTNYRSSPDVVFASNAIFGTELNPNNLNPFDEQNISFEPVKSGIEKGQRAKLAAQIEAVQRKTSKASQQQALAQLQPPQAAFTLHNLDDLLLVQDAASEQEEVVKPVAPVGAAEVAALSAQLPHVTALSESELTGDAAKADAEGVAGAEGTAGDAATGATAAKAAASAKSEAAPRIKREQLWQPLLTPDGHIKQQGRANTYVVSISREIKNKDTLNDYYATIGAQLVRKLLDDGEINDKAGQRRLKSGDIAILVRSARESDLMQQKLWELLIPSVYYSDRSSVLSDGEGGPSAECLELSYLMEAMCDCTNRHKISRVLGSRLLSLSTEEFKVLTNDANFEQEVKIMTQCAQVWEDYGFMPAFLQWAADPRHDLCARLLGLKDGERLYTNYCHISEIMQRAHTQKGGIQAQLHWFYELIYQNQALFDQDVTKKRLESEQEQVKIITVHKSKGLEFPVVIMPFLWTSLSVGEGRDDFYGVSKYYDAEKYKHIVLDYQPHHDIEVVKLFAQQAGTASADMAAAAESAAAEAATENAADALTTADTADTEDAEAVAVSAAADSSAADSTVAVSGSGSRLVPRTIRVQASQQSVDDDRREQMRLLYVAITRARYANFFIVGNFSSSRGAPSALAAMQGDHSLTAFLNEEGRPEVHGVDSADAQLFIDAAAQHPELFTLLDGEKWLPPLEDEEGNPEVGKVPQSAKVDPDRQSSGLEVDADLNNFKTKYAAGEQGLEVLPCAMSFLYKDAIDTSFNIFSYTSLVKGDATGFIAQNASDQEETHLHDGADDTAYKDMIRGGGHNAKIRFNAAMKAEVNALPEPNLAAKGEVLYPTNLTDVCSLGDPDYSISALAQQCYEDGGIFYAKMVKERKGTAARDFPRGARPGTFVHLIMQNIDFPQLRERGWEDYLISDVMYRMSLTMSYKYFVDQTIGKMTGLGDSPATLFNLSMSEWLNDVLEAPIVRGRYHCLALADMEPLSFEREMDFMMSNSRFNIASIDKICQEVAYKMLPPQAHNIIPSLRLGRKELIGYCHGSIDLACRFDLNTRLPMRFRQDLLRNIPEELNDEFQENLLTLRDDLEDAGSTAPKHLLDDLELNPEYTFKQMARMQAEEQAEHDGVPYGPDYKYFVIDYKTNFLGNKTSDYQRGDLLASIYTHRYDVQFLIYSLALYRFLKRRMAVPFTATYEELRAFYDKYIGGVIYLYLRGMRANYLRDAISPGVFMTKLDFDDIYRLDAILGGEEQ